MARKDDDAEAVVLHCEGRTFFAGMDITEFGNPNAPDAPSIRGVTRSAVGDLNDIVYWVAQKDSAESALYVLDQIQEKIDSLAQHPDRGSIPPELRNFGVDRYREVFFKPYRIIYHVREHRWTHRIAHPRAATLLNIRSR